MLEKIKKFKGSEVELEYLLTGEENSETIMFVHGAGANLRQFTAQHQHFSDEYKVLSVSLRGHGNSTNPPIRSASAYSMEKHREDVLEILEHLKIESLNYVGNSAGGMVGYELVNVKPHLFKCFVTFGTTAELRYSPLVTGLIAGIDSVMMKINPSGYCRFVSKHSSRFENVQKEIYDELILSREAVAYFRKNLGNYSYLKVLEKMHIPFLLIQGEVDNDINRNLKTTLEAIKNNKSASVVKLPEAGHFANLDKTEDFNKIVENFIKNK
jgi:3-oxoadipate enol-lactonase